MPLTPQDRVRRQVAARLVPKIAELILQADKGSESMKLTDLRSEESRYAYLADALMLLEPEQRFERVKRVNQADALLFALKADEDETLLSQARNDVARFAARPSAICYVCAEPVITNKVMVTAGPNIYTAHGLCCAKDEQRFELVDEFTYRLRSARLGAVDVDPRD